MKRKNIDCISRDMSQRELRELVDSIKSGYDPMMDIKMTAGRGFIVADTTGDPRRIHR